MFFQNFTRWFLINAVIFVIQFQRVPVFNFQYHVDKPFNLKNVKLEGALFRAFSRNMELNEYQLDSTFQRFNIYSLIYVIYFTLESSGVKILTRMKVFNIMRKQKDFIQMNNQNLYRISYKILVHILNSRSRNLN